MNKTIRVDAEFKTLIPPLSAEELYGLERSILQEGCRDALVIWKSTLIDGHNRYQICKQHNIKFKTIQVDLKNRAEAREWILVNALSKRNLTPFEKVLLALELENIFKDKARLNQGKRTDLLQNSAKGFKSMDTREEIAKLAGVSHDTVMKVKKIKKLASDELLSKLKNGKRTIRSAYEEIKVDIIINNNHKIPKLPKGKFRTIYADPPWQICQPTKSGWKWGTPQLHYKTMKTDKIIALKTEIEKLSAPQSHLYLWTTNNMIPDAIKVMEAWGFEYITMITWFKNKHSMGQYYFGYTEHCLMGRKGKPLPFKYKNGKKILGKTGFNADKGKHSEKPEIMRKMIEEVSHPPYLELFARKKNKGWTTWGNELG